MRYIHAADRARTRIDRVEVARFIDYSMLPRLLGSGQTSMYRSKNVVIYVVPRRGAPSWSTVTDPRFPVLEPRSA